MVFIWIFYKLSFSDNAYNLLFGEDMKKSIAVGKFLGLEADATDETEDVILAVSDEEVDGYFVFSMEVEQKERRFIANKVAVTEMLKAILDK